MTNQHNRKELDAAIERYNISAEDQTAQQQAKKDLNADLMPALVKADKQISIIDFISSTDAQGRDYWLYLKIPPSKHLDFTEAFAKGGSINFLEYGTEVESGWGKSPDAETKQRITEKYGLQDNFEDKLVAAITQKA